MNIINWFINNWVEISAAVSGIVVAARIIVKLTPTPKDDNALAFVVNVLKQVGLTSDTLSKKPTPPQD